MRNKHVTKRISVIVPAHNEEKNIAKVLQALQKAKNVDEIICIDDGSTDNTRHIIKKFPYVKEIYLSKNCGKAFAMTRGIMEAKGEIVVFVDADIEGVTDVLISQITKPLLAGTHDVVVGYPSQKTTEKPFLPIMGQRAYFKKDLLPVLPKMRGKGYGVELFLNYHFRKKRIAIVGLSGIRLMMKYEKQPYNTVARLQFVEVVDIVREIFRQDNPFSYVKGSYLDNFYINRLSKDSL